MIRHLALCIALASCGIDEGRDFYTTDEAFRPYLDTFAEYYGEELFDRDVVIGFKDLQVGRFGNCYYKKLQIDIDRNTWESLDEFKKEALIFHELGHCILKRRGHINDVLREGVPVSLMHKYWAQHIYEANREYYIQELFENRQDI